MRTLYRTIVEVEILSEDEPVDEGWTLGEIDYQITEGHCSGMTRIAQVDVLSGPEMAAALRSQGSDPEFFQLDDEGNEVEQ